jgi:ADP-dependent NAD(P)H-hydrate dehydratase / NAD(P)H-hydrate epimerase
MLPLYSTSQIRELDKYAIKTLGIPGSILMENAAIGIVQSILEKFSGIEFTTKFGIVCGKGNNGGDGYAVARHLSNYGFKVKVISVGAEKQMSEDCRLNYNILKKLADSRKILSIKKFLSIKDLKFLSNSDIIIDALLGTGVTGKLNSPFNEVIGYLNNLKAIKIAIDIPTGLNADSGYGETIFNSDLTITLGDFKKGLFISKGSDCARDVELKEIGIGREYLNNQPVNDYLIEPEDIFQLLPAKEKSLHKYSAGKVFVIAGSEKYPGAAVLTSNAALKSGAGSVILGFPEDSRKLIQKNLTEVVFQTYKSDGNFLTLNSVKGFSKNIKWADVIAVGPGLDRNEETIKAVRNLIKSRQNKPLIIDADGIYAISKGAYKNFNLKNTVLTPHIGEFSELIDVPINKISQDINAYGKGFAVQTNCYLVLKGSPTIIFTPAGESFVNTTGNPGMAKFGTGDVLTGMISSFIAQTKNLEGGILLGVYLHSLSADLLLRNKTEYSLIASDIIENIPHTINFIRNSFD